MKIFLPFPRCIPAPRIALVAATLAAALISATGQTQQPPSTPPAAPAAPATPSASTASTVPASPPARPVKFQRPNLGAPAVRLTGGSRGEGRDKVILEVLAPDEVGLTTEEQPSLFWFQSQPSPAGFELTLLRDKQAKPLLHLRTPHADRAGIQRVRLADHGVKLQPGIEYQWVVALITDPENRSTDLIASGAIQRVEPGPELSARLTQASPSDRTHAYAEAGIWYDALATLSDQVDAHPESASLRDLRRDLLRQVGLKSAAQN